MNHDRRWEKTPRDHLGAFSWEQIVKLLEAVPVYRAAGYLFMATTGMPLTRMRRLTWGNFDLNKSLLRINTHGKVAVTPLLPIMVKYLRRLSRRSGHVFLVPTKLTWFQDLERAGLPRRRRTVLRKSLKQILIDVGCDIKLAELLVRQARYRKTAIKLRWKSVEAQREALLKAAGPLATMLETPIKHPGYRRAIKLPAKRVRGVGATDRYAPKARLDTPEAHLLCRHQKLGPPLRYDQTRESGPSKTTIKFREDHQRSLQRWLDTYGIQEESKTGQEHPGSNVGQSDGPELAPDPGASKEAERPAESSGGDRPARPEGSTDPDPKSGPGTQGT